MASSDSDIMRLLTRELSPYMITEPSLQERVDAVLRAGEQILVVEAKVSTRPGVPFGSSDVHHILSQQEAVKRVLHVVLNVKNFEFVLLTNRLMPQHTWTLLTENGFRVVRFQQDPTTAILELKAYVDEKARTSKAKSVKPIDNWTLGEVRAVLSATSPEDALQAFLTAAGQPDRRGHASLVPLTNEILKHYAAPAGPDDLRGLSDHVKLWLKHAEKERVNRNQAVDLAETAARLLRRVAFLEELVQSCAASSSVLNQLKDSLRQQDVAVSTILRQAERFVADPKNITPEGLSFLVSALLDAHAALETVAETLQAIDNSTSETGQIGS